MTAGGPAQLRFSIIVASWDRAVWLRRCLLSLRQLDHGAFEIIVVADPASLAEIDTTGLKTVQVDDANLPMARNLGVAVSAGDICAFIDDDSVAEPYWLRHFEDAFLQTSADAVVGFVRGRNGISFQSQVCAIDAEAETHLEPVKSAAPYVPQLATGRALKLVGTNFAVRRDVLIGLGGFDERMRFFLEDTDLSLRLHRAGHVLAVAPLAEVHHGFAASARRDRFRVPRDLYDIGCSTAVFLTRHFSGDRDEIFDRVNRRERARLLRHMVGGHIEPGDVAQILRSLVKGWEDGSADMGDSGSVAPAQTPFKPIQAPPAGHEIAASRFLFRRKKAESYANQRAAEGARVTVFSFSLTNARHFVRYSDGGYWLHTGGIYGRTNRQEKWFRWCKFAYRVRDEIGRIAKARGLSDNHPVNWWGANPSGEDKVK